LSATACAFWKGGDGNLWQAQGPAARTQADGVGHAVNLVEMGTLGSAPAAGVDAAGNTYVFWQGADGNLWEAYWDRTQWAGPHNLGMGQLGSQPAVAISNPPGQPPYASVFWKGADGNLWGAAGNAQPGRGGLSHGSNMGMGTLGSAPTAGVDVNGNVYVYWKGNDGDLWGTVVSNNVPGDGQNLGMGQLGSQPAVAIHTQDPADPAHSAIFAFVFWKGADGNLWEAQGEPPGVGPAHNRGMGVLGSAPAAGVDAAGNTYVFWEGADGDLWEAYWDGAHWTGPYNLGMGQLGSQPAVAIHG
jgi:hypothetical protein